MMRMKVISLVLFLNYVGYASVTFIYCIGRDRMMVDKNFNMVVCCVWNFVATVNVTLVLIILIFKPKLLSPLSFSSKSSNTEVLELSADKLEKGGKIEHVSTSHYKSFEETTSKTDFEEQKNFYNMVIESTRNKVKIDDKRNSCRQSISQTNLISVESNN
ncbi:hypothetical protein G6F56_008418 [Rhizopus delemar]|nr:hypothetical protein G6F56_008418 [Rhizopus delemar]